MRNLRHFLTSFPPHIDVGTRSLLPLVLPIMLLLGSMIGAQSAQASTEQSCPPGATTPIFVHGVGTVAHLAPAMQKHAQGMYEIAAGTTGATDCSPIHVELTQSGLATKQHLPAWHLPPWAAGAALPTKRKIVLHVLSSGVRQDRERVLLHELAHLSTYSAAGGQVPRWFDEGVARIVAGEDGAPDARLLAGARLTGRLPHLSGLVARFPGGADPAGVAYAYSARAIAQMRVLAGHGVIARVLRWVSRGLNFDQAVERVTGVTVDELDAEVRDTTGPMRALGTLLVDVDFALGFGGVLLVVGGIRSRRRFHQGLSRLAAEERLARKPHLHKWVFPPEPRPIVPSPVAQGPIAQGLVTSRSLHISTWEPED